MYRLPTESKATRDGELSVAAAAGPPSPLEPATVLMTDCGVDMLKLSLPILFPVFSVNHRLPSGPVVIRSGPLPLVGTANSVITPAVVILPILLPLNSVNQRLPSGPELIPKGALPLVKT